MRKRIMAASGAGITCLVLSFGADTFAATQPADLGNVANVGCGQGAPARIATSYCRLVDTTSTPSSRVQLTKHTSPRVLRQSSSRPLPAPEQQRRTQRGTGRDAPAAEARASPRGECVAAHLLNTLRLGFPAKTDRRDKACPEQGPRRAFEPISSVQSPFIVWAWSRCIARGWVLSPPLPTRTQEGFEWQLQNPLNACTSAPPYAARRTHDETRSRS